MLFLNLDGYESEFNLELMRNFEKHVMYVSLPRFDSTESDEGYNHRFHKKIMYSMNKP